MKADCTKCFGICCKWGGNIKLSPRLEPDEINQYSHVALNSQDFRLKMALGRCIYLKKGKCTIYDRRPKACREYDCIEEAERIVNQSHDPIMDVIVMGLTQRIVHEYEKTNSGKDISGDS